MERLEIFKKLVDIFSEQFDVKKDQITEDTKMTSDLNADSLDFVEMAMELDDQLGISIPDEKLEALGDNPSVSDIIDLAEQLIKQKKEEGSAL